MAIDKFNIWDAVANKMKQVIALVVSSGPSDGGKIVATDETTGRLHQSVMPIGVGPETKNVEASEALAAGAFVNFWDDGGTIKARNADATLHGKMADGYVVDAVAGGANVDVYLEAINNQLSGLTLGARYYLSTTAGAVTATPPTGATEIVQYLGKAVSATELTVEIDGEPLELA